MSQKSYGNSCSSSAPSPTHTSSAEHCAIRSIWYICTMVYLHCNRGQACLRPSAGLSREKGLAREQLFVLQQLTEKLENHLGALRENLWIKCRNITGQHKMALQRATRGKGRQELAMGSCLVQKDGEVLPPTIEQHWLLFCSVSTQCKLKKKKKKKSLDSRKHV